MSAEQRIGRLEARKLIGSSRAHRELLSKLTSVAITDAEVLIEGPSGVGKELYAQHVHDQSHRQQSGFVPVNCGALTGDLLENILFGHVGGAFTGAKAQSEGLVAEAEGGTLFLDEVDSLGVPCQIKLLRFLQDKKYRRLGENRLRQANVRVIAATNADLEAAVLEGRFRKDLFFRLRVVPVEVPALCRRTEDIPEFIDAFSERFAATYSLPAVRFSPAAIEAMIAYPWPGNVRELENCVAYLTCLQLARSVEPRDLPLLTSLQERALPAGVVPLRRATDQPAPGQDGPSDAWLEGLQSSKRRLVAQFERRYLEQALKAARGNVSAAARMSGKNRRALFELMRKYEISADGFRKAGGSTES